MNDENDEEFMDEVAAQEQFQLLMASTDVRTLRGAILELVILSGRSYRQARFHKLIHPVFFLAGFLTCYFFVS